MIKFVLIWIIYKTIIILVLILFFLLKFVQLYVGVEICIHISTNKYSVDLIRLLNGLRFINSNTTYLLNRSVVSTHLSDFIKAKKININQIDLNYEKSKN